MKFGKLSKFIFGCLAASPLVCTPLSSCSPQIADEVVTVETKSLVTADYNFSINFDFHLEVNPTVYIQVMNLSTPAM
ncbi:MAG: hypothetical protein MJ233_00235 [Mycoplasmoidaceae bacterium]|nr:hypothetical protein [Mycoplasmoidaceae bacterium]